MFEKLWQQITTQINLADFLGGMVKIIIIMILAKVFVRLTRAVVERVFSHSAKTGLFGEEKRIQTMKTLLKSIVSYGLYFIAGLMILSILGVNTASILASAGILGLAVGFGAQNLVKDVITGFFIVFDHYFVVGDFINTAGVSGVVEEIGLRTTKIRDGSGDLHILPNSVINQVTNSCRGKMRALVDIPLALDADVAQAVAVIQAAADKVASEMAAVIIDPPVVLGIQAITATEVLIRVVAYAKAMEQWSVERELRRQLKQALDDQGIKMPDPRRVMMENLSSRKEV